MIFLYIMINQTYQEVSKVIEIDLRKIGNKRLNEISKDFQEYFYNLKQENPNRYERLTFNVNDGKPHSSDLEDILGELRGRVIGTRLYIKKKQ